MTMPVASNAGLGAFRASKRPSAPRSGSHGQCKGGRRAVLPAPRAVVVDTTTDFSQMFKEALKTPASQQAAGSAPAAAVGSTAAAAPVVQAIPPAAPAAPVPEVVAAPTAAAPAAVPDVPALAVPDVQAAAEKALGGLKGSTTQLSAGVQDKAAEAAAAAGKAAAGVTDALTGATSSLTSGLTGVTGGLKSSVTGLTSKVGDVTGGLKSSVTDLTSGVTGTAGEVAGKLTSSVTGLTSSVTGSAGEVAGKVTSTLSGAFSSVTGTLDKATSGVQSSVGSAVDTLSTTTAAAQRKVEQVVGTATASVQQVVDSTTQQFTAVTTQVTTAVDSTMQQVLDALPPPVKDGLLLAGKGVGLVAGQAVQHPLIASAATLAVAVPLGVNYYKARYGGYAGEVSPQLALDVLQDESQQAFLVDIRPEAEREADGTALLKRGARFRVAAFPLQSDVVSSKVAREVSDLDGLKLLINAAYIAGLNPVPGPLTKVFVMDAAGSDKARGLARALVSVGMPLSYVMEGGYKGWVAAELPTAEAADYDAGAAAVLADEVEVLAERANEVVTTVAQPSVGIPLVAGTATTAVALYNWHYTLQYIGVLGVLLTIANKLIQYDSPAAALDDAAKTAKGAVNAIQNFKLPSAPKLPSVPKLPSLPSVGAPKAAQPAASSSSSGAAGATVAPAQASSGSGSEVRAAAEAEETAGSSGSTA